MRFDAAWVWSQLPDYRDGGIRRMGFCACFHRGSLRQREIGLSLTA